MESYLSVQNVSVDLGRTHVLNNISFGMRQGEILTVVGPSGCGKSTLLNLIAGVIRKHDGHIMLNNLPIVSKSIARAYIPQHLGLLPWKKVRQNIMLPSLINHNTTQHPDEIISTLGLSTLLDRYPAELSGGQRQRVALARVFVTHPDILLMDEPFSALDTITAETTRSLFLRLWQKRSTTTIFTTHNLNEATQLGKRIMLLTDRPASVMQIVENPFFGSENNDDNQAARFRFVQQLTEQMRQAYLDEIPTQQP